VANHVFLDLAIIAISSAHSAVSEFLGVGISAVNIEKSVLPLSVGISKSVPSGIINGILKLIKVLIIK